MSTIYKYVELPLPTNGTLNLYDSLNELDDTVQYIITGNPTLTGNVSVTSTNPNLNVKNRRYNILWQARPDFDGNTISIFGVPFTQAQSNAGGIVEAYNDGSNNTTLIVPNFQEAGAIGTYDLQDDSVTNTKIADSTISTAKFQTNSVTPAVLSATLQLEVLTLYASFETGEAGAYKITIPYSCQLQSFNAQVIVATAGGDSATITASSSIGNMTPVMSIPPSIGFGTVYTVNTSASSNNLIALNTDLTFTTEKATPGGKVNITAVLKRV